MAINRDDAVKEVERLQRMLGLRGAGNAPETDNSITLDFTQKARYTLDESIVFVAIDTEADDRGRLTELGFAFLVVAELGDVAPGQHGSSWAAFLHPKHYNIAGEDGIKGNMAPKHRYCQQDPAGFNKFMQGTAETAQVDWEEARAALRNELQGWVDDGAKLVLVVHAMKNELAWLEQLDFSVAAFSSIIHTFDTQVLDVGFRRPGGNPTGRSLRDILDQFPIPVQGSLHNAGVDAIYTMHALLACAVGAAEKSGT